MTIYDAPKILSVHLKRFTFTGQKINRHVKFDTKLELNSVMSTNKKHPELNYGLYAVLVHAGGSCHSGHYYCYVKGSNGSWYSMNDSHVRDFITFERMKLSMTQAILTNFHERVFSNEIR